MTVTPLGRDQDCSLKIREPDVLAPWFLDPGGWSKTAAVSLYFIFPGICTLSLLSLEVPPPLMFPMTVTPLGRDQDCSLMNREPDGPAPWFLDPGARTPRLDCSSSFLESVPCPFVVAARRPIFVEPLTNVVTANTSGKAGSSDVVVITQKNLHDFKS
ncbi:hypothetical protein STEG23_000344 [Scotinomys teguina]